MFKGHTFIYALLGKVKRHIKKTKKTKKTKTKQNKTKQNKTKELTSLIAELVFGGANFNYSTLLRNLGFFIENPWWGVHQCIVYLFNVVFDYKIHPFQRSFFLWIKIQYVPHGRQFYIADVI